MLAVEPLESGRWDEEKRQDQGARRTRRRWEIARKQRQKESSRSDYRSVVLAAWKEGEGLDEMVA